MFKIPEAARVTLLATNSRVKRPEPTVRAPRAAASVASAGSARSGVAATPSRRAAYQVAPPPAGRDAHGAAKHPAAAPSNPNGRAVRVASRHHHPRVKRRLPKTTHIAARNLLEIKVLPQGLKALAEFDTGREIRSERLCLNWVFWI